MLWILLMVSAVVLAASWLRPPTALWQKAVAWGAAFLMVAVLVALGIEAMMQTPVEWIGIRRGGTHARLSTL